MNFAKVHFELDVDKDGFPPVNVEILNGIVEQKGLIKIDNTPFFVEGIALGDLVLYSKMDSAGNYKFRQLHQRSGNKALSVIFMDDTYKEKVYQYLRQFGCYCEYGEFGNLSMLSVAIDAKLDYREIARFLDRKEAQSLISYAELCIR